MDLVRRIIAEEMETIRAAVGDRQFSQIHYGSAARLFDEIIADPTFAEFLTLKAYDHLA
jgi:malate synthase